MEFIQLRKEMVEDQLMRRGINDPATLESFGSVPRERFVPESRRRFAYEDGPLPIGEGQTISQPYIVALMTQALQVGSEDKVLEIGTGSGYQAAILSQIVDHVYTVERIPSLTDHAREAISALGYTNISFKVDDGTLGWPEHAPYDAIIVTAGGPTVPEALVKQLKVGGRLVIPVGNELMQTLVRIRKLSDDEWRREDLESVRFVPLIGEQGWQER